ncbi:metalloprotease 1 [Colletotrichum abscissum]|uniref:Metalloprotease 1 n=1 Tax=Colletotrichum abscissum TaxID=1671311 RepID=A0A9Q0B9Y9_9PEZI|nr:metalloprotease 1 [Colletotrichum abscissum]KAI3557837.1 metalloprotease 1 [Colletotrichum abscissum]KAK1510085.1 metalloprotease 1 [Colletotrichum abscissum]
MATKSCLLLTKSSISTRPGGTILAAASYEDPQGLVEAIEGTFEANTSKAKRFLKTNVLCLKPTVSIATLRSIEVPDLTALPPLKALIRHSALDEAFTEAVNKPQSMDQGFYTHLFDLYDDIFVDIDQREDRIVLPRHALLIEYKMSSKAKKVIGGLASVIGGLTVIAVKAGEGSLN